MARMTIRQRRQQRAEQSAQCAEWAADFLATNPAATKKQVLAHVEKKANAAGFDWATLFAFIMQLLSQLFAK